MNLLRTIGDGLALAVAIVRMFLPEPRRKRPPVKPAPVPARTPAEEAERQAEFDRGTHRVGEGTGRRDAN